MKFNKLTIFILIAGMAALITSCRKDALPDPSGRGDALQINVTVAGFTSGNIETRAINTGYATTFSTGDRIGITVVRDGTTIVENNIPYAYSALGWNPVNAANAVHYYPGASITYLAHYPYNTNMDGRLTAAIITGFNPQTDQSTQTAYDASDLMTGTGALNGTTLSVTLTHALSLIELNFPAGVSSVVFDIDGGASLKPYIFEGAYRYIAKPQTRPVVLKGSYSEGSEKKNWQLPNVTLTAGKICRINIFPPFFIEGYTGGIQVFYTDGTNETTTITDNGILKLLNGTGKIVMRIVLLDQGSKSYWIGRTTEQPIRLRFDPIGDLQFRPAAGGFIPVGSYAELLKISETATTRSGNYMQEANLDLLNIPCTPVCNFTNRFTGVFDGNQKTISRLSINSASVDYVGLFGAIGASGTVQNVDIYGANITGKDYVGGIVGYLTGGSIKACKIRGTVNGRDWVGGIAGYITIGCSVGTCENSAAINGRDRIGGIVGCVFAATSDADGCTINACKNTGTVISKSTSTTSSTMTGGIVGQVRENNTVRNCYSTGNITGENNVGGVVGNVYGSLLEYCYATGTVNGTNSIGTTNNTGGVAGLVSSGGILRYSVALNTIVQATSTATVPNPNVGRVAYQVGGNLTTNLAWDGISNGAGIPFTGGIQLAHNRYDGKSITSAQARMRATYVNYVDVDLPDPLGWDFVNIWKINEGNGYPALQWE